MDHDLVPLARGTRVNAVMKRGLGEQGEGVGLQLAGGRRFGNVRGRRSRGNVPAVPVVPAGC